MIYISHFIFAPPEIIFLCIGSLLNLVLKKDARGNHIGYENTNPDSYFTLKSLSRSLSETGKALELDKYKYF